MKDAVLFIREPGHPLGLFRGKGQAEKRIEDDLIRLLVDLRTELREKKEFALSDRIRDRLSSNPIRGGPV
ncbi:hypothetical protein KAX17_14685 [Candidatus Bipolaricaulota bacterium]|nr:hypothetical protein [Candidatus Bipolaricaulota bacterium]